MKETLIIISFSALVGLASAAWLVFILISASKKVSNKEVLKRWLRMRGLLIISVVLLHGCSPGQLVGTGYLVSVRQNGKTEIMKVATRHEADSIYLSVVGSDPLGSEDPFYEFQNSETFIYIEKKGIYERNGKRRWKMYDEKLNNLNQ